MAYKQKLSKLTALRIAQQYEDYYETEERKLILEWDQRNVNESYQAIVLNYLDQFSGKELQQQISIQLQRTYDRSTFYHKIEYLLGQRQQSVQMLYECALKLQIYKKPQIRKQPNLQRQCDLIDHIRKTSMLISEAVWEMFQYYSFHPENSRRNSQGQYYLRLFKKIDEDISFLKDSIIKYYIPFSDVYDPLLIQSSKNLRRLYNDNHLVYNQSVEILFNINASYLYRLLRAQQRMFHFLTLNRQLQKNQRMTPNYLVDFPPIQKSQRATKQIKPIYSQLLKQDKIKKNYQNINKSIKESRKNQYQRLKKQVIRKSRSNTPKRQQQLININGLDRNQIKSRKKNDRRAIVQCDSVTIYNNINKSRKSFRPEINNNYADQVQKQSSLPKNLDYNHQYTEFNKQSNLYNKRTNTDPGLHQNHNNQFNEPQPQLIRYFNQNSLPTTDTRQHISPMPTSKRTIESLQQNPLRLAKKHSKSLQFPKLSSSQKQDHKHEGEDCLCRQKYKNRRPRQSYAQASEDVVDQRRKTLIRTINQKYKELAQKQIRYELSLLGDQTYHRMKNKIFNSRVKQTAIRNKLLTKKRTEKAYNQS